MKSKLVKYPFDEKKYRWDTHKMGKTFEYSWDKSLPKNFNTITPYIKADYLKDYMRDNPNAIIGKIGLGTNVLNYDINNYSATGSIYYSWSNQRYYTVDGEDTRGSYLLMDATDLKEAILPSTDIRYVYYIVHIDTLIDKGYITTSDTPQLGDTYTFNNMVYDNGEWRNSVGEITKLLPNYPIKTNYDLIYANQHMAYWIKQEYSPLLQLQHTRHNDEVNYRITSYYYDHDEYIDGYALYNDNHYIEFYDNNGVLQDSIKILVSKKHFNPGSGGHNVCPGNEPYCRAYVKSTATFKPFKITNSNYRHTIITLNDRNHYPLSDNEYKWVKNNANANPNIILNILALHNQKVGDNFANWYVDYKHTINPVSVVVTENPYTIEIQEEVPQIKSLLLEPAYDNPSKYYARFYETDSYKP